VVLVVLVKVGDVALVKLPPKEADGKVVAPAGNLTLRRRSRGPRGRPSGKDRLMGSVPVGVVLDRALGT
jgi:hypothetical protein